MREDRSRRWNAAVAPLVQKCRIAGKFGHDVTWNTEGADALGKLLTQMATIIDDEIEARASQVQS